MKLIESSVTYIPQGPGLEGIYKQIELAGRTAYKSEDKITEDSAKKFVDMLIRNKHYAALEHGTVCLDIPDDERAQRYLSAGVPWVECGINKLKPNNWIVTTNFRVLVENGWLEDLKCLCEPNKFQERRYTFKFICSRAIAQELTRHRAFSFLMESQRYVNYSKEKYGGEITFIKPSWANSIKIGNYFVKHNYKKGTYSANFGYVAYPQDYLTSLCEAENAYFEILNKGRAPQQARDVLPNATKTELIMTGFASAWRNLLDIRYFEKTGSVHPDMLDLMQKLVTVMKEVGIYDDIMKYPSKFD